MMCWSIRPCMTLNRILAGSHVFILRTWFCLISLHHTLCQVCSKTLPNYQLISTSLLLTLDSVTMSEDEKLLLNKSNIIFPYSLQESTFSPSTKVFYFSLWTICLRTLSFSKYFNTLSNNLQDCLFLVDLLWSIQTKMF